MKDSRRAGPPSQAPQSPSGSSIVKASYKIFEKGTVPGCIGTGKPYPPNRCDTCRQHSDYTCDDLKKSAKTK